LDFCFDGKWVKIQSNLPNPFCHPSEAWDPKSQSLNP
jgi:hypothetical protein